MEVEILALLIPIIGIVFGIGIAVVAIVANHREKLQRNELRYRERLAAIEKGLELPPDTVEPDNGRKAGGLKAGVSSLLIGIVLYFALRAVADEDIALFGLIPAAVGLANLVFYFLEGRKN